MPSLSEVIATLPPEHRGIIEAAQLNLTTPCTVLWCEGRCQWEADIVGGSVARLHGLDLSSSGNHLSQLEYPPGSPETDGDSEPHLYVTQEFDNDGLLASGVVSVIAELTEALHRMTPGPATLAAWAPPAWASKHYFDTGCLYAEHQVKQGDAQVCVAVTDELVLNDDGIVQVVRSSPRVYVTAGTWETVELSIDCAWALAGSTDDHDLSGALIEALAVYDGATR